ncbi:MAG: hypothetical protein WD894_05780 [Pirellulales bacterium]
MWCQHCQSDVPQTAGLPAGSRRCCRCGRSSGALPRRAGSDEGLDLERGVPAVMTSAAAWDDWTLAAEVQRARLLLTPTGTGGASAAGWRIDGKHLLSWDPAEQPGVRHQLTAATRPRRVRHRSSSSLTALVCGVVILCCGVVVAASLFDAFATVTRLGVPLMLIGLFGLAVGVLLQLHHMRRDSRVALDRMRLLDLRLQEYRQAALLVGPTSQVSYGRIPREYLLTSARTDDPRFRSFDQVAAEDF